MGVWETEDLDLTGRQSCSTRPAEPGDQLGPDVLEVLSGSRGLF